MMSDDELAAALEELVQSGEVERAIVDGEPRYRLTAAGIEQAEQVLRCAGVDPDKAAEAMRRGNFPLDVLFQALQRERR